MFLSELLLFSPNCFFMSVHSVFISYYFILLYIHTHIDIYNIYIPFPPIDLYPSLFSVVLNFYYSTCIVVLANASDFQGVFNLSLMFEQSF